VGPGAGAELQGHRCGRTVGHQHGDGQREDTANALLPQGVPLVQKRVDTTDAGAHDDAKALRLDLGRAGVGPGLAGGDQAVLSGGVESANLDPGKDIDGRLLDRGRDLDWKLVGLDPLERHQAHA